MAGRGRINNQILGVNRLSVKLWFAGLVSGVIQVNRMYSIDLYDTTMDYQDIRITDELIKSQLMWPRMSLDETKSSEDKGKYVNAKVQVCTWFRSLWSLCYVYLFFWSGGLIVQVREVIIRVEGLFFLFYLESQNITQIKQLLSFFRMRMGDGQIFTLPRWLMHVTFGPMLEVNQWLKRWKQLIESC